MDAISVENLTKSFGKLEVLKNVSFSVKEGSILALLGPNGAGKTTTIKILTTLLKQDSGNAFVSGFDVVKQVHEVKKLIGLTGQYAAVDEYLNGIENLEMMGNLYKLDNVKQRAKDLLEKFELTDAQSRPVRDYSGGMRRRLDLAMTLISSPKIIFLDEPTTGLDPRSRLTLWGIIKQLAATGTTILLTTQYMDEAEKLANDIIVIDGGKVIASGTIDELKKMVGAERLEIVVKTNEELIKLNKLFGDKARYDSSRKTMVLPAEEGIEFMKKILKQLEHEKIDVETLSLHKPTLDDVFLTLTGHKAEEEK